TIIIHYRMSTWVADNRTIPEWKNKFRAGYLTLNNAFRSRRAIDWVKTHHKPLFATLFDATDAFPSTNQDRSYHRLIELAMGVPA
ncbi:uncharacterized protein EV420DRAFT_1263329, partial [Desarmillaria tabescens]